jgi:hypothetical protein
VCAHAKDAVISQAAAVHIDHCPAGQGQLDFRTYLIELSKCQRTPALPARGASKTLIMDLKTFFAKQAPPLMLEHLAGIEECRQARDFIFKTAQETGVTLWTSGQAKAG